VGAVPDKSQKNMCQERAINGFDLRFVQIIQNRFVIEDGFEVFDKINGIKARKFNHTSKQILHIVEQTH
jgi:hypothetical protein